MKKQQKKRLIDDFVVMILCHGRAENTPTWGTLRKYGYTGRIWIICDDEDEDLQNYKDIFGESNVKVFSKDEVAKYIDTKDDGSNRACAVYARNACFDIAETEAVKYFAEYDDDYISHPYRWEADGIMYRSTLADLDSVFEYYLEFLETNDRIFSVAFGQPGDFIGGVGSQLHRDRYRRKCMNSWICKTNRRIQFNGTMNDDASAYFIGGSRGEIYLTFDFMMIDQPETQQVDGGMTEMYLGAGTYQKTWYSVIECPSFVKVGIMGDRYYRIHHSVSHENAYPKIISGHYKKGD